MKFFTLFLTLLALNMGHAEELSFNSTENGGMNKYERINLIEKRQIQLHGQLQEMATMKEQLTKLVAEMKEMKAKIKGVEAAQVKLESEAETYENEKGTN
ncbi:MAG: hypothetical protein HOE90_08800 [Bacteriovoracaceae bacterium]|jgi:hypothetical protein|nr:hypothetical protein [Bacteriovoracaceae bacterium]